MKTKPIEVIHEKDAAFGGTRTGHNPLGELKRANFDHLMDLLREHPDRVAISRRTYEYVYEQYGVKIWPSV